MLGTVKSRTEMDPALRGRRVAALPFPTVHAPLLASWVARSPLTTGVIGKEPSSGRFAIWIRHKAASCVTQQAEQEEAE